MLPSRVTTNSRPAAAIMAAGVPSTFVCQESLGGGGSGSSPTTTSGSFGSSGNAGIVSRPERSKAAIS